MHIKYIIIFSFFSFSLLGQQTEVEYEIFSEQVGFKENGNGILDYDESSLENFVSKWLAKMLKNEMTGSPTFDSFEILKSDNGVWFLMAYGTLDNKNLSYRTRVLLKNQDFFLTETQNMEVCLCNNCPTSTFNGMGCECESASSDCLHRIFISLQ